MGSEAFAGRVRAAFYATFLGAGSAHRLGVTRALFYLWFVVQLVLYEPGHYARLPAAFWEPPLLLGIFAPPDAGIFDAAVVALYAAGICASLGLFTRVATAVTALLALYVVGVMNGFGARNLHLSPVLLIACVMPFAPSGAAVSLDRWLGRRGRGPRRCSPLSADFCWPVVMGVSLGWCCLWSVRACRSWCLATG